MLPALGHVLPAKGHDPTHVATSLNSSREPGVPDTVQYSSMSAALHTCVVGDDEPALALHSCASAGVVGRADTLLISVWQSGEMKTFKSAQDTSFPPPGQDFPIGGSYGVAFVLII